MISDFVKIDGFELTKENLDLTFKMIYDILIMKEE